MNILTVGQLIGKFIEVVLLPSQISDILGLRTSDDVERHGVQDLKRYARQFGQLREIKQGIQREGGGSSPRDDGLVDGADHIGVSGVLFYQLLEERLDWIDVAILQCLVKQSLPSVRIHVTAGRRC